ncbi:MAG TPA: sigma-70 family RNA polymerase sigma factor [Armatimonadota bacterium]|nr:sigma-70 family RNA polymerase sigma factor [Armatimonadota bacterium]
MIESYPDGELVARAREGDRRCFSVLCDRYRGRLWRIAVSVAAGCDAEDLAQEAMVRAYRALDTYQGQAPFGAWLCRIAVNIAHDYHRSAWKRRVLLFDRMPDEETQAWAEHEVERRELQRRVRQAVAALPERQRVPIWLHYFEGFSVSEVARLERAPEATVRSRVRAGLQRLSGALGDLLPEPPAAEARGLEPDANGCGA